MSEEKSKEKEKEFIDWFDIKDKMLRVDAQLASASHEIFLAVKEINDEIVSNFAEEYRLMTQEPFSYAQIDNWLEREHINPKDVIYIKIQRGNLKEMGNPPSELHIKIVYYKYKQ